jgi:thymidylate synthase (FAD)
MGVTLVDSMGDDLRIVNAARLSLDTTHQKFSDADEGLIRTLIKNGHGTPFEKVRFEFLIEVPIFVAREWFKHRMSSFNEVSGRYSEYKPKFYVPRTEDVRQQVGKKMSYEYETLSSDDDRAQYIVSQKHYCSLAWEGYEKYLEMGIAREVARNHIPLSIYTKFFWGTDLRNLTNFLVLRNAPQALREINRAAMLVEESFEKVAPVTYRLWNEEGRPRLAALDN